MRSSMGFVQKLVMVLSVVALSPAPSSDAARAASLGQIRPAVERVPPAAPLSPGGHQPIADASYGVPLQSANAGMAAAKPAEPATSPGSAVAVPLSASPTAEPDRMPRVLIWFDWIIRAAAVLIVSIGVASWTSHRSRDPLDGAAGVTHQIRVESLLLMLCCYLFAFSIISPWIATQTPATAAKATTSATDNPAPENPGITNSTGGEKGTAVTPTENTNEAEDTPTLTPLQQARLALADLLAKLLAIVVILASLHRLLRGGLRSFVLGPSPLRKTLLLGGALGIVALPLCELVLLATVIALQLISPSFHPEPHQTLQMLRAQDMTPFWSGVLYVGAAVMAPVAEEIFFRGLLQNIFKTWLGRRWRAILLTSLCFALVHNQSQALPALVVLSILLGYAYEKTGSLLAPIMLHAIFNGKTLLWLGLSLTNA